MIYPVKKNKIKNKNKNQDKNQEIFELIGYVVYSLATYHKKEKAKKLSEAFIKKFVDEIRKGGE